MRRCLVAFVLAMVCLPAWAWGPLGHRLIGAMAERQLEPAVRERALALLASDPLDSGGHLADVANWADAVRGAHDPRYTDSYRWHWTRFDAATCHYDAAKQCAGGQCIVAAIDRFSARLADRRLSSAQRAEALRFLVHFVGDVHQPMHAGYRNDRNGFDVALKYRGESWSLHGVWDYLLLDSRGLADADYVAALMRDPLPAAGKADPIAWAESSCAATRDDGVYPDGAELDVAWVTARRGLAEQRLRLAAARLASLIDAALRD